MFLFAIMHSATRNLLPQRLGFSPGTSLIGNFGSTEAKFTRVPLDGAIEPDNPGPGTYNPKAAALGHTQVYPDSSRYSWGTAAGHNLQLSAEASFPGPGTYGEQEHPCGDILTGLQRQWPGIHMSGFGTNASLPTLKATTDSGVPGPGTYEAEESSRFVTSYSGGFRSPYVGAARHTLGSRLQRDLDAKTAAVFASRLPAHRLPVPGDETGAAISNPQDGPGPPHYSPVVGTMAAHSAAAHSKMMLRSDLGRGTSFDTTAVRKFSGPPTDQLESPGPGAHTIVRYSGEQPTVRRPRSLAPHTTAARSGFLSSTERFGATAREASDPNDVMQFLAGGHLGPIGRPEHHQIAMRQAVMRAEKPKGGGRRS